MLGGQIGCDYQFAPSWVVGIEGGAAGGNIGGSTSFALPAISGDSATFKEATDMLSQRHRARRIRLGSTGCFTAKAASPGQATDTARSIPLATYDYEGVETRFGWTAGVGIEWALWNDWSLKLEYDYYGFGTRSVTFIDNVTGNVGPENMNQNIQVDQARAEFSRLLPGVRLRVVPLSW